MLERSLAALQGLQQGPAGPPHGHRQNKRLGHALAIIKKQQDLKDDPKVITNIETAGYRKRRRKTYSPDLTMLPPSTLQGFMDPGGLFQHGDLVVKY